MIVQIWHNWVNQPKKPRDWHEQDIADELAELAACYSFVNRWSETSDVVYTVTRARWSGHDLTFPISRRQVIFGYIYMYPKYNLRVLFFRRAGRKAGASDVLQSVRNPKKVEKLAKIAEKNKLASDQFIEICQRQLRYWPLLP